MSLTPSRFRYWSKYSVRLLPNLKKKLRKRKIVVYLSWIMSRIPGTWHDSSTVMFTA